MVELSDQVRKEYERWIVQVGPNDPYVSDVTIGIHDVLKAHFLIADFFYGEGRELGGLGPRDIDLLHSALHRQHVGFGGKAKWEDKFDICATLMYGLIMDHPFFDANKRTAFLSALLHLKKFGRCPSVDQKTFEDFTVKIANHDIRKFREFKELSAASDDPEVAYISRFLRQYTRVENKEDHAISYRDLLTILKGFGFAIENPWHNRIEVVQYRSKTSLFSKKIGTERIKLGTIGFPRWTARVSMKDIRYVRRITHLTYDDGVDSEAFFRGADPVSELIAHYQEPLRRLANR